MGRRSWKLEKWSRWTKRKREEMGPRESGLRKEEIRKLKRVGNSTWHFWGRQEAARERESIDKGNDLDTVGCHSEALLHLLSQFVETKCKFCLCGNVLIEGWSLPKSQRMNHGWSKHSMLNHSPCWWLGVGKWQYLGQIYIKDISIEDTLKNGK